MNRLAEVREGFLGRDRIAFAMRERVDFESSVGRRQMEALGKEGEQIQKYPWLDDLTIHTFFGF